MEEEEYSNHDEDDSMEMQWGEIKVEEEMIGGYEFPNLIFSKEKEKRIQKPWRRSVIVKLLAEGWGKRLLKID